MQYEISMKKISEKIILEDVLQIVRNIWILVATNSFPLVLPISDY